MPNAERLTASLQLGIFSTSPLGPALKVLEELLPSLELPNVSQRSPVQWQVTGKMADLALELQASPSRVDLIATGLPVEPGDPAVAGVDLGAARKLLRPIAATLAERQQATRLACIIQSLTDADDSAATIELARAAISGLRVPTAASEIDYKVNVPRKSRVDTTVTLNRHHRWTSIMRAGILIDASGAATQHTHSWSLLEVVDVNTDTGATLTAETRTSMLDEVIDEAHQLDTDGYSAFERLDI